MIVLMLCCCGRVIQALIIFTFNALFVLDSRIYDLFYRAWMHMQLATVDQISATTYRFFFNSAPYMVIGILCLTYLQLYAHRFRWFYAVGMGLCLAALMLTFTRSIYGAAAISLAIALVFALVYCARRRKRLAGQIAVAMAAFALLVVFQQVALGCNTAQFAIARTFNLKIPAGQNDGRANEESNEEAHDFIQPDEQHMRESYDVQANNEIIPGTDSVQVFEEINLGTDYSAVKNEEIPGEVSLRQQQYIIDTKNSDQIRENTLQELNEMICRSPVFGNGLGAAVACREGGYVEYFYQDIVNKTGFFGLLLYYFPIGYMVFSIARKWKSSDADRKLIDITWICGMTVFLAATYFNPYMNSSLGICCLSIAIACFRLGHSRQIRFKAA
jgi:O-antigen ligase